MGIILPKTQVFQNKRNPNKFIEVKRYKCGHYVWRQFIENEHTGIRNYTGCSIKRTRQGVWRRASRRTIQDTLQGDYKYFAIFI